MDATTSPPTEQPDWMRGFEPKPRGNPTWTKGGPSPNPAGRPKGIVDRRQKVQAALMDDAPAIARVVIDAALDGDMQAAGMVLARISPALRSQAEKVTFAFDPTAPIARQVEQVLGAIAAGEVSPDVGKQIVEAIHALSAVRAVEELEQRIAQLEEKQG